MKFMGLLTTGKVIESPKELLKNTKIAIKEWNLMPMDVEAPNDAEWRKMAKIRGVTVDEAKRQLCANCEYFDNSDSMMAAMNEVPENEYDVYGNYKAQRGYCTKLHFICHVPRSCQAWEAKEYESEDKSEEEDMMEDY